MHAVNRPLPRRLLLTADAVGGVWTYAVELSRALSARHVDVLLAVLGPAPSADQRNEVSAIPRLRLAVCNGMLEWMPNPWEDVAVAGRWLLELTRDWQPEVVHLNGYCHAGLPWKRPVLVTAHSCVRSWWCAVRGEDPPASWNAYTAAVARGLAHADTVVAPSAAMLATLREH